jgi:hypothetical protein
MTQWMDGFVPDDGQLFRRTMGETLAQMVRRRWPHHTAKQVAKAWDLDPTTAANLTKGHASERTLTKAIRAEGWDLLEAMGEALTGQSYADWKQQKFSKIIEEANRELVTIHRLRALDALVPGSTLDADPARVLDADCRLEPADRRGRRDPKAGARREAEG